MPFAAIDNNIIHYQYIDNNRKANLVLINSLGTSCIIWDKMLSSLSEEFNILLHDKRGHGYSSTSGQIPSIDTYARDVIHLMDTCKIDKANILGLSIGGLITYSLASQFENRCLNLIFSNTGAKIGSQESWEERINNILQNGMKPMIPRIIQRWISSTYASQNSKEIEGYKYMLSKVDMQGYINACHALGSADYREVAKEIHHPSLFVAGSEDVGTPPEFVKQNAELMTNSNYRLMEGVAHLPCIEAPDRLVRIIKNFLL